MNANRLFLAVRRTALAMTGILTLVGCSQSHRADDQAPMHDRAAARILASDHQLVVCDDPGAFTEASSWQAGDSERGFAGNRRYRMIGTEADLNDHWVEVELASAPPQLSQWDRVTCVALQCTTGKVHVMSLFDKQPSITVETTPGPYSIFVAGCNLGVDQLSLGEEKELSDEELSKRKDLEWYRVFVVPGEPDVTGRIKDNG